MNIGNMNLIKKEEDFLKILDFTVRLIEKLFDEEYLPKDTRTSFSRFKTEAYSTKNVLANRIKNRVREGVK